MSELKRHIWVAAYSAAFVDIMRHDDDTENGLSSAYVARASRAAADRAVIGFRAVQRADPTASIEVRP